MFKLTLASERKTKELKNEYAYSIKFDWLKDDFISKIYTYDQFAQFQETRKYFDATVVSSTVNSVTIAPGPVLFSALGNYITLSGSDTPHRVKSINEATNTIELSSNFLKLPSAGSSISCINFYGVGSPGNSVVIGGVDSYGVVGEQLNIGDGSITDVKYLKNLFSETWYLLCVDGGPSARFVVKGSSVGVTEDAYVGIKYSNRYVSFNLTSGSVDFEEGDVLKIYPALSLKSGVTEDVTLCSGSDSSVSPVVEGGPDFINWGRVTWGGSNVSVFVRSVSEKDFGSWSPWVECESGELLTDVVYGRYLQFKFFFHANYGVSKLYDLSVEYDVASHTADPEQKDYIEGFNRAKTFRISRSKAEDLQGYSAADASFTLSNHDSFLSKFNEDSPYSLYMDTDIGVVISVIYNGQSFTRFKGSVNSYSVKSKAMEVDFRCKDGIRALIRKKVVRGDILFRDWSGRKFSFLVKALLIDAGVDVSTLDLTGVVHDPIVAYASFKDQSGWAILQEIASGMLSVVFNDESGRIVIKDAVAISRRISPPALFINGAKCLSVTFNPYTKETVVIYLFSNGSTEAYIHYEGSSFVIQAGAIGSILNKFNGSYICFNDKTKLYKVIFEEGSLSGQELLFDTKSIFNFTNVSEFDNANVVHNNKYLEKAIISQVEYNDQLQLLRLYEGSSTIEKKAVYGVDLTNYTATLQNELGDSFLARFSNCRFNLKFPVVNSSDVQVYRQTLSSVLSVGTKAVYKYDLFNTEPDTSKVHGSYFILFTGDNSISAIQFWKDGLTMPVIPNYTGDITYVNITDTMSRYDIIVAVKSKMDTVHFLKFTTTYSNGALYIESNTVGVPGTELISGRFDGSTFYTSGMSISKVVEGSAAGIKEQVVGTELLQFNDIFSVSVFNAGSPSFVNPYYIEGSNSGYGPNTWRFGDSLSEIVLSETSAYVNIGSDYRYFVVYNPAATFTVIDTLGFSLTDSRVKKWVSSYTNLFCIYYDRNSIYNGNIFYIKLLSGGLVLDCTYSEFASNNTLPEHGAGYYKLEESEEISSVIGVSPFPEDGKVYAVVKHNSGSYYVHIIDIENPHTNSNLIPLVVDGRDTLNGFTYDYSKKIPVMYGGYNDGRNSKGVSYSVTEKAVTATFENLAGKPVKRVVVRDMTKVSGAGDRYWYFQKFGGFAATTSDIYAWSDDMVESSQKIRCAVYQDFVQLPATGDGATTYFTLPSAYLDPLFDIQYVYVDGSDVGDNFVADGAGGIKLFFTPKNGAVIKVGNGKKIKRYSGVFRTFESTVGTTLSTGWGSLTIESPEYGVIGCRVTENSFCNQNGSVIIRGYDINNAEISETLNFATSLLMDSNGMKYVETTKEFRRFRVAGIDAAGLWVDDKSAVQFSSVYSDIIPGVDIEIYTTPNTLIEQFGGDGTVSGYTDKVGITISIIEGVTLLDSLKSLDTFTHLFSDSSMSSVYLGSGNIGDVYVRSEEELIVPYFSLAYDKNLIEVGYDVNDSDVKNKIVVSTDKLDPVPFRDIDVETGLFVGSSVLTKELSSIGWSYSDLVWAKLHRLWDNLTPIFLYKGNNTDYDVTFSNPAYVGDIQSPIRFNMNFVEDIGYLDATGFFTGSESDFNNHVLSPSKFIVHAGYGSDRVVNQLEKVYRAFAPWDKSLVDVPAEYPSKYNRDTMSWSSTWQYYRGDSVFRHGFLYCCIVDNLNQDPSTALGFWSSMLTDLNAWDVTLSYAEGSIVKWNGCMYRALQASQGVLPSTDTHWLKVYDSRLQSWAAGRDYQVGEYVSHLVSGIDRVFEAESLNVAKTPGTEPTYWDEVSANTFTLAPYVAYAVGDLVESDGRIFRCTSSWSGLDIIDFQDPAFITKFKNSWVCIDTLGNLRSYDLSGPVSVTAPAGSYILDTNHGRVRKVVTPGTQGVDLVTEPVESSYIEFWDNLKEYSDGDTILGINASDAAKVPMVSGAVNKGKTPSLNTPAYWVIDSSITKWEPGVTYLKDSMVIHGGVLYRAILTNRRLTPPSTLSDRWEVVSSSFSIDDWDASKSYKFGDIVFYLGTVYSSSKKNIGIVPFIIEKSGVVVYDTSAPWVKTMAGYDYVQNRRYSVNDVVIYSGCLYKCVVETAESPVDSTTSWELQNYAIGAWSAGTYSHSVVLHTGEYWYAGDATTDEPSLSSTDWVKLGSSILVDWDGAIKYPINSVVKDFGKVYKSILVNKGNDPSLSVGWISKTPSFVSTWVPQSYSEGSYVEYSGLYYTSLLSASSSDVPGSSPLVWTVTNSLIVWSDTIEYGLGDLVVYNEVLYKCIIVSNPPVSTSLGLEPDLYREVWEPYFNIGVDVWSAVAYSQDKLVKNGAAYYLSETATLATDVPGFSDKWSRLSIPGGDDGDFTDGIGAAYALDLTGGIRVPVGSTKFRLSLDGSPDVEIDVERYSELNQYGDYTVYAEDIVNAINDTFPGTASVERTVFNGGTVYVRVKSQVAGSASSVELSMSTGSSGCRLFFGSNRIRRTASTDTTIGEYEKLNTIVYAGGEKAAFTYYQGAYSFRPEIHNGEEVWVLVLSDSMRASCEGKKLVLHYPTRVGVDRLDVDKTYMSGSGSAKSLQRGDGKIRRLRSYTPAGLYYYPAQNTNVKGLSGFHLNMLFDVSDVYSDAVYLRVENPTDNPADALYVETEDPSGMSVWVSRVELRGRPMVSAAKELTIVRDQKSIKRYQEIEYKFSNPYVTDVATAKKIANYMLPRKAFPLIKMDVSCVGLPIIQLGDIIGVNDIYTFLNYELFELISCEESMNQSSGYTMSMTLTEIRDKYTVKGDGVRVVSKEQQKLFIGGL